MTRPSPPDPALLAAITAHVQPGMHLHFASTPSRSNAAIEALATVFRGTDPRFVLSATGFHSTAHLLAMQRLGRRYVASFFGDNYPGPRPNRLYTTLRSEGADIEIWSLGAMVAAFRAGAMGLSWGMTRSLVGSSMGQELVSRGMARWMPECPDQAMVAALRPDVTVVHGLVADTQGRVLMGSPLCEGAWSALAARSGVIATVEAIVSPDVIDANPAAMPVPAHRMLAVCVAPQGALPQPLPGIEGVHPGYDDDFDAYRAWRTRSLEPEAAAAYAAQLWGETPADAATPSFVSRRPVPPRDARPRAPQRVPDADVRRILLAARWIEERVQDGNHRAILAGIGQSFLACRIASSRLQAAGLDVPVMVETGLYGVPAIDNGHPFLLSGTNMRGARRLSSVEDVLQTLTCGSDARCLGVIGAGEIDDHGRVNSTWAKDGSLLVGSGGANDIASAAAEVIVLAPASSRRLVPEVSFITSPGGAVSSIVTELGVLHRTDCADTTWTLVQALDLPTDEGTPQHPGDAMRACCPWTGLQISDDRAEDISQAERRLLMLADPSAMYWRRSTSCSESASPASVVTSRSAC